MKLKATVLNELKSLDYQAHLQFHVELYLELSSITGFDPINILSWSLVSMNALDACVLVSGIIDDVEMTVFWKGSNCPSSGNTCSGPGILMSILTCLGKEMRIHCGVISQTSLDGMWILETWSMNCFLTTGNICIYCLCFETLISFIDHSFVSEYKIWIKILNVYPLSGVEIKTCVSSWAEGVVEVPSSFPLRGPSPHLRTHCHCLSCSMMMNLQTLASLLVVQIALTWRKALVNPHQLSL